jgi:hypothetical protein
MGLAKDIFEPGLIRILPAAKEAKLRNPQSGRVQLRFDLPP